MVLDMDISKELLDMGLTEQLLLFYHSRTVNMNYKIIRAFVRRYNRLAEDGSVRVTIVTDHGTIEYTMDIAKIREKRLNLLLNEKI
jgi:hypothetical protein